MAPPSRDNHNGPSVDAMLRGLTDRPNVQSTLILSRIDGSIIRATGLEPLEKQNNTSTEGSYRWVSARQDAQPEPEPEREGGTGPKELEAGDKAGPTEVLAATIFHFVNSATSLGLTLGSTSRSAASSEGTVAAGGYSSTAVASKGDGTEEESDSRSSEDEVQLLRLRTKHQEIIIFPDSNYICCVVQRAGKAGHTVGNRR
ncbi:hypothetical protein H2202_004041 [Exophiala xenobiotica]|nr:hypothetical protein H2202_004041 [Exophiala xenobiotica]KAK5199408.1 hypothetical protein LTR92_001883 [Exophiala xenobiotica]KAK5204953.1 hypothetical protein LTR41_009490 [Exophiala xenobiotica]KAK5326578.1 hypothetical protein LTR93_003441 [Exophiala xenobiotica]KAK5407798.1 hypothetical protein LTR06_007541 [Exophiala xenobiotica]